MRTTITIDEGLLAAVKEEAHRRGGTVSQVIAEAVRLVLLSRGAPPEEKPFRLVTFRGDGPLPGIDLDRTSEILDQEDIESYRPAR